MIQPDKIVKVSVVMATYNGEKYIREQIDSILAQTYPIYEIIIQDDCSTDRTAEIIKEYSRRIPFIHFETNDTNIGFNQNFKKAVFRSTGEYVALSDQDDIWFDDKLSKQVSAIKEHTMCYCYHLRGVSLSSSHIVDYKCAPERQLFDPIVGHSMLLEGDFARNPDNWMGVVAYDYSLGINAHLQSGVSVVKEALVFHRVHDKEVTFNAEPLIYKRWFPFVFGYFKFREIQKSARFSNYFSTIKNRSAEKNRLIFALCKLMLSRKPWHFLYLQCLCLKHYKTICPARPNALRGFFHPQIYSTYHIWD